MTDERGYDALRLLGHAAAGLRMDGLPAEVVHRAKQRIFDTVGCLVAGYDSRFDLIKRHDIRSEDVAAIEAECMRRAAMFNSRHPDNGITAQASLPYCLAAAICTRDPAQLLGPAFRPSMLQDETLRTVEDKVSITENEEYERQYPARSLAKVTITLRSGAVHSLELDRAARARYLTPTNDDLEQKFRTICTATLGASNTDRVIELARRFDTLPDVTELIGALTLRH